jgi:hypothetical protein
MAQFGPSTRCDRARVGRDLLLVGIQPRAQAFEGVESPQGVRALLESNE